MDKNLYRFNLNLPIELKDYLAEVSWRNRTTITAYIVNLVRRDMELGKIKEEEVENEE